MPQVEGYRRRGCGQEHAALVHRHICAEMLEQIAAGGTAPYPYGDVLYLLETVRPAELRPEAPGDRPRPIRALARLLTRLVGRRPMARGNGEGSGRGRRGEELPDRGVPA